MKKRVIWKIFLLEIVTLGIYRLYWFIKTRREMMDKDKSIKIMTPWFFLIPVLVMTVGVVFFVMSMVSSTGKQIECAKNAQSAQQTYQEQLESSPDSNPTPPNYDCPQDDAMGLAGIGVFYLSFFVAYAMYIIWIWSYSQGVAKITKEKLSFAVSLLILVLVPDGIDILIVQDSYNKIGK